MRIRLTEDLLVIDPKHGAKRGREFDVIRTDGRGYSQTLYFCKDAKGREFGVYARECEVLE